MRWYKPSWLNITISFLVTIANGIVLLKAFNELYIFELHDCSCGGTHLPYFSHDYELRYNGLVKQSKLRNCNIPWL